VAPGP